MDTGQRLAECIRRIRGGFHSLSDTVLGEVLARGDTSLHAQLLKGCRVRPDGQMSASRTFIVHPAIQHKIDYALWRLAMHARPEMGVHPSLLPENIRRMRFRMRGGSQWDGTHKSDAGVFRLPEEMATLPNLTTLSLAFLGMKKFPDIVLRMDRLERLDISGNPILSLPDEFLRLRRLRYLNVSYCGLERLPEGIDGLDSLVVFLAAHNSLKEAGSLWGLQKLVRLDLSRNPLESFRPPGWALPSLRVLELKDAGLDNEKMGDRLPGSIRRMDLSHNAFNDMPSAATRLENLLWLDMSRNLLKQLCPDPGSLTRLHRLDITGNESLKWLPDWLSRMEGIRRICYDGLTNLIVAHVPERQGEGMEGFRRLLADQASIGERGIQPARFEGERFLHTRMSMARARKRRLYSRLRLSEDMASDTLHRLAGYLSEDVPMEVFLTGLRILRTLGEKAAIEELLQAYVVRDGRLYGIPDVVGYFGLKSDRSDRAALEIIGWMDDATRLKHLGESRILRLSAPIDASSGLHRSFPQLEEAVLDLANGPPDGGLKDMPNLRRLTLRQGNAEDSLAMAAPWERLERLTLSNMQGEAISLNGLTSLQELELDRCEVSSVTLRGLPSLRKLLIHISDPQKRILIADCPSLLILKCSGKGRGLTGLPECRLQVTDCPALISLTIRDVSITDCPGMLAATPQLRKLVIDRCGLRRIPGVVGSLVHLETLRLRKNDIRHIPKSLTIDRPGLREIRIENAGFPELLRGLRWSPMRCQGLWLTDSAKVSLDMSYERIAWLLADPGPL